MATLPPSSDFTGSSVTEGQFKTAMTSLRNFLGDLLGSDGTKATALSTIGALASSNVAKTAGFTVVAADRGKVFECSGTFTVALTAAATLGSGFSFIVKNTGTGTITIDPNSNETIDGLATLDVSAGASAVVSCNGSGFYSVGGGGTGSVSGVLIGYQVFTASGSYSKGANNPSFVIVELVGGGGKTSNSTGPAVSGGCAGGYARKKIQASSLASTETVTVGAGATASIGGTGGTTSFGAHCSATGGGTSSGGLGSGGDINARGGVGDTPFGTTSGTGGNGGDSFFCGGGHGAVTAGAGTAGHLGGGGGGSVGSGYASGSGGSGIVIVWEYA